MTRDDLVRWLNERLSVASYRDASMNGLQVEGTSEVHKVALAVDASMTTFEQAADVGADFLVVHHGLLWGTPEPLTGMLGRRVKFLMERDLNLYVAHLPLDAHATLGNNWGLARKLGMVDLEPFCRHGDVTIGVKAAFPAPVALRDLADDIEKILGESVLVHAGGPAAVRTMGIVSGSAAREVHAAAAEGLDALLTGEPKHDLFHAPFELGVNALFAGHYMTETVGVQLLGDAIAQELGLATEFLLLPTGL